MLCAKVPHGRTNKPIIVLSRHYILYERRSSAFSEKSTLRFRRLWRLDTVQMTRVEKKRLLLSDDLPAPDLDELCISKSSLELNTVGESSDETTGDTGLFILTGTFWWKGKAKVRLCLSETALLWKGQKSLTGGRVPLTEMTAIAYASRPSSTLSRCLPANERHDLCVHSFQRCRNKATVWKPIEYRFGAASADIAHRWVTQMQQLLRRLTERPRRLWIFINPFSGSKQSMKKWKRKVRDAIGSHCVSLYTTGDRFVRCLNWPASNRRFISRKQQTMHTNAFDLPLLRSSGRLMGSWPSVAMECFKRWRMVCCNEQIHPRAI